MSSKSAQSTVLIVNDTVDSSLYKYKYHNVVNWNGHMETSNVISILRLAEENKDKLKEQYLSLIYEFGELDINGKRTIDYLEIFPKFSYWWMTLIAEKCNYAKSPQINDVIKLLVLRDIIDKKKYKKIIFFSSNKILAESIKLLSIRYDVGFEWNKVPDKGQHIFKKGIASSIYRSLPLILQALTWLAIHLLSKWHLKGIGIKNWKSSKATITFVSYLLNLTPSSMRTGKFESLYWTSLSGLMDQYKQPSNWLHIYTESSLLPSSSDAKNIISKFNNSTQVHVTLYSFLNFNLIIKVLYNWLKLVKKNRLLCSKIKEKSDFLWPLFMNDCKVSMLGSVAMSNMLNFHLLYKAMALLPIQKKGFYLQENQGWESCFIYSWHKNKHKECLFGVPHSTISYWDMRFFSDKRSYDSDKNCYLPSPDFVCVNGPNAKNKLMSAGYSNKKIIEVEALRYLYLGKIQGRKIFNKKTLLILGDYSEYNTRQQMELLMSAEKHTSGQIKYLFKPHPSCSILVDEYRSLDLTITNEPINALINKCSMAYAGSATSAAVDFYCTGKPVVIFLNHETLNLSPLNGINDVTFVDSSEELSIVLKKIGEIKEIKGQCNNYFYLDAGLPRWKKIIAQDKCIAL